MTPEEIKNAAYEGTKNALADHHICIFDEVERQLLRDFISIGNMFKSTIMKFIVVSLVLIIAAVIVSVTNISRLFNYVN